MRLERDWIAAHLPHQGRMCLLDEVLSWDPQQLQCRTGTHRRADHPLRAHGRLGGACALEYAAQAAAVHGALLALSGVLHTAGGAGAGAGAGADAGTGVGANVGAGMLVGARAIELAVERLDDIAEDLLVGAVRLYADARSALYSFELQQANAGAPRRLAHGRLSLWLPAG
jgi:predicted hotdog family 3-hydroxylacyl-ACP dehydratase